MESENAISWSEREPTKNYLVCSALAICSKCKCQTGVDINIYNSKETIIKQIHEQIKGQGWAVKEKQWFIKERTYCPKCSKLKEANRG